MRKHRQLYLQEEILLLALNDEKGTVHFGALFDQAAGGAILAELLLGGRLGVEGEKKKARVFVKDATPMGEPLLDECLEKVAGEKKRKKAVEWAQKFAGIKKLKHRIAAPLVEDGLLKEEEDTVLLVFNRTIYPESDGRPEREITQRMRRAIVGSGSEVHHERAMELGLRAPVLSVGAQDSGHEQRNQRKNHLAAEISE